jgi:acetyltransferase-like isoleucine patch superfamily enzyme
MVSQNMLNMFKKVNFWLNADRFGPDMPLTHWLFHFNSLGFWLAKKRFNSFGDGSSIRPGVYIVGCSKISVGNNVVFRPGSMLHANTDSSGVQIMIEDKVLIGSGVHVYVDKHRFTDTELAIYDQGFETLFPVFLKEGSWIGANSIILPGVTIGKNSVIGAGSVVTKSVPDFCVAVGNPARVVRYLNE